MQHAAAHEPNNKVQSSDATTSKSDSDIGQGLIALGNINSALAPIAVTGSKNGMTISVSIAGTH